RQLTGSITVNFVKTISDPLNITILITESGIVAAQLNGVVIDSSYVHHNVLRDIITNVTGDAVGGSKTAGTSWKYSLSTYTVNSDWNADSCRVIAFVSKAAGSYDVLQVLGTPLKN
ncbi:MAG: Omp28-related outer membrane protein, partial [Chitinophagales bacterium]